MFFLILFGFYHVFLTGRTAAKNNIQFQPYRSNNFAHLLMKKNEVCRRPGGEIENTKIKNT